MPKKIGNTTKIVLMCVSSLSKILTLFYLLEWQHIGRERAKECK